jgi:hypothetical protein
MTNDKTNNNIFYSNDLNFNNHTSEEVKIMCDHNLPLVTTYPKLIMCLFTDTKLKKIISLNNIIISSEDTINLLINVIKLKTQNSKGKTIIHNINIADDDLWKTIIDIFIDHNRNSNSTIIVKRKKTVKKLNTKEVNIAI